MQTATVERPISSETELATFPAGRQALATGGGWSMPGLSTQRRSTPDQLDHRPARAPSGGVSRGRVSRRRRGCNAWVGFIALGAALAGCQNPGAVDRRLQQRRETASWAANTIAQREAAAVDRLEYSAAFIEKDLREYNARLARDWRMALLMWQSEVTRWQERQPLYRDKAAEVFRGNPEQIDRMAVYFW